MQGRRLILLVLLAITPYGALAQDDAPPTWSIRASIAGEELVGEWELSELSKGAGAGEVFSSAEVSKVGVQRGSSFQIHVELVNPAGEASDITGSAGLIYRPKACLTITAAGVATVAQSSTSLWACNKGDPVPITIIYIDKSSGVAAVNMYMMTLD